MTAARIWRGVQRVVASVRFGRRYGSLRFARRYDRGKSFEDSWHEMVAQLERVVRLDGATVADIGCGTGQLVRRIGARLERYHGVDLAPAMIQVAEEWRAAQPWKDRVSFAVAPAASIPLADRTVDLTIYTWSMNSVIARAWDGDWQTVLRDTLAEGARITRPGGTLAVVETASLAGELPWGEVWHPVRRAFLSELETTHGFERVFYANDWDFRSARNVRRYAGLWFNRATITALLRQRATVLSECAGIWWRRLEADA